MSVIFQFNPDSTTSTGKWKCPHNGTEFFTGGPPCCGCKTHDGHIWLYTPQEREAGKTIMGWPEFEDQFRNHIAHHREGAPPPPIHQRVTGLECPRCLERGKTWNGQDPKCAFASTGTFQADNYMCATMNRLREIAEALDGKQCKVSYHDDCNAALLPAAGYGHIVLQWYKSRGRTDIAIIMDGEQSHTLNWEEADNTINELEQRL